MNGTIDNFNGHFRLLVFEATFALTRGCLNEHFRQHGSK